MGLNLIVIRLYGHKFWIVNSNEVKNLINIGFGATYSGSQELRFFKHLHTSFILISFGEVVLWLLRAVTIVRNNIMIYSFTFRENILFLKLHWEIVRPFSDVRTQRLSRFRVWPSFLRLGSLLSLQIACKIDKLSVVTGQLDVFCRLILQNIFINGLQFNLILIHFKKSIKTVSIPRFYFH